MELRHLRPLARGLGHAVREGTQHDSCGDDRGRTSHFSSGVQGANRRRPVGRRHESPDDLCGELNLNIHYLEIVTNDVDSLCAAYERVHALSFGPEDPDRADRAECPRSDHSASRNGTRGAFDTSPSAQ